jgi:Flp pilus assembly CpaF family ATPase
MSKLRYEQYPDKNTTKELIAEKQYDYVVFDDLHRLIFDANMAESTLKAYNWAVDLGKQYDQCNLILGHPNDVNATMETFVLSGGVRVHKDLTTIVAMLKTDEKGINEIKVIVERKRVKDLHAKIVLNGILDYKLEPLSAAPIKLNTVLKPLGKQANNELMGLDDLINDLNNSSLLY